MPDVDDILQKMAENFRGKIDDEYSAVVQFDFEDLDEARHVIVELGRKISVKKGRNEQARYFIRTTSEVLRRIADGEMTAMTAGGKASGSDSAPLDLELADDLEFNAENRAHMYVFLRHFFNLTDPEKILLGEEHSRLVHGGHAIPLYYSPGFRSAWYMIKKGEKINEPGDTNPFPQAFIFIEGKGSAQIGDRTIEVRGGESYYIPPGSNHVVRNDGDEPLVLIWLAWGEGA